MKTTFTLILIFAISFSVRAQKDSTEYKLQQLRSAIEFMRDNLNESHEEYKTGVVLNIIGLGVTTGGILLPGSSTGSSQSINKTLKYACIGTGLVAILVGTISIIDSHGYIGKAGRFRFNGTSISFY